MKKIKSLSITTWIFVSMILGVATGFIVGEPMQNVQFVGTIWIQWMKIALAPIVLVMIAKSIGEQNNGGRVGFIAAAILIYYTFTTFFASFIGIGTASVTRAGVGFEGLEGQTAEMEAAEMTISGFFLNLVPDNLLKPLVEANMIQVLFIGIIVGIAILLLPAGKAKTSLLNGLNIAQELLNNLLKIGMHIAPIGVFCSMSSMIGQYGSKILGSIFGLVGTLILGVIVQTILVYCLVVILVVRKNPLVFIKRMIPSMIIGATTASSLLVVPSNLNVCKQYDVEDEVSNFTIPLGAVFNLDGAAIFFPCVILFAAQATGMHFDFGTLLNMAIMGTIIASSGGGVFGGSLVKCMVLSEMFGVPSAIMTVVASVFVIIDAIITLCNVSGDVAGTLMVATLDKRRRERKIIK